MNRVRIAVVPAAGLGTRMRPATEAVPKELLPIGGRPAIDWVLEEARMSGIERVVIVTSPSKVGMKAYLAHQAALSRSRDPQRDVFGASLPDHPLQISFVTQRRASGLGDAVRLASDWIGREPVAVLLPDELMFGGALLLASMLEHHARTASSLVSLLEVTSTSIGSYGCAVCAGPPTHGIMHIDGCVEKPNRSTAPSSHAICGRYVLDVDVLDRLHNVVPDERGEIQLTPALDSVAKDGGLLGLQVLPLDGRVDVGNWVGWLDANRFAFPLLEDLPPFANGPLRLSKIEVA